MTEIMKLSMAAINKWFYFCYNYPYNFIESIWGPKQEGTLSAHLQEKFKHMYELYGSKAVMNTFYAELDLNSRKKLLEWVLAYYNSEVKLNFSEED